MTGSSRKGRFVAIERPVVLLTGFGPFPGVPVNPSAEVVRRIASGPLGRHLGVEIVTHIFDTTFASLDRLPEIVAATAPDACLHLGIAARSRFFRVETRGTNFTAPFLPDAEGAAPDRTMLDPLADRFRLSTFPARRICARIAAAGLPARLSPSAGRYLCNVLLWHSLALAEADGSGRPVGFLHLPPSTGAFDTRRPSRPGRDRPIFTIPDLVRATTAALTVMAQDRRTTIRSGCSGSAQRAMA